MKEVFTKSFWQGVKKTFDQALEDPPPPANALQAPAEADLSASSSSATLSQDDLLSFPLLGCFGRTVCRDRWRDSYCIQHKIGHSELGS
jgi:hypothetical protein